MPSVDALCPHGYTTRIFQEGSYVRILVRWMSTFAAGKWLADRQSRGGSTVSASVPTQSSVFSQSSQPHTDPGYSFHSRSPTIPSWSSDPRHSSRSVRDRWLLGQRASRRVLSPRGPPARRHQRVSSGELIAGPRKSVRRALGIKSECVVAIGFLISPLISPLSRLPSPSNPY